MPSEVFVVRNALKRFVRYGYGENWEKDAANKILRSLPDIGYSETDDYVVGRKQKGKKAYRTGLHRPHEP
jgi:hypothetical protein